MKNKNKIKTMNEPTEMKNYCLTRNTYFGQKKNYVP